MFPGMDFELREYVKEHVIGDAAFHMALLSVLLDHELTTEEEFKRAVAKYRAAADQEYQAMKDERTKT